MKRPPGGKGRKAVDVAGYIANAAPEARPMLRQLRAAIRSAAPMADETISYRIPYYRWHGRLINFAAFREHVSVYVMGRKARKLYARELKPYQSSAATLRFTLGSRVPIALVKKIVKARLEEIEAEKW
jgi:uncharacterized protein YdhG (YjbR/CyaY superfamily)